MNVWTHFYAKCFSLDQSCGKTDRPLTLTYPNKWWEPAQSQIKILCMRLHGGVVIVSKAALIVNLALNELLTFVVSHRNKRLQWISSVKKSMTENTNSVPATKARRGLGSRGKIRHNVGYLMWIKISLSLSSHQSTWAYFPLIQYDVVTLLPWPQIY